MKIPFITLGLMLILASYAHAEKLSFSGNRSIEWSSSGEILLKDSNNKVITKVNLLAKVQKKSGAKSLGLEIEETDLGGESSSKTYLKNKRVVHGKQLDGSVGAVASETIDVKNVETSMAAGLAFKKTYYQNGAYAYQVNWGPEIEEVFFDAKGNLRYNKKTKQVSLYKNSRTVWVDGSVTEQYQNTQGAVSHTIDSQDNSSRFGFTNAAG